MDNRPGDPAKALGVSPSDRQIINGVLPLVRGISTVFGSNCGVSLHVRDGDAFPCVAHENGELMERGLGSNVSAFLLDIIRDESYAGGRSLIDLYYVKLANGHALKTVASLIRNPAGEIIACLCIGIDLSVPLHEFIRTFIPVVDDNLANSLAEPSSDSRSPNDIYNFIQEFLELEIINSNELRSVSPTEKNKRIVKELQRRGIFKIRGSTSIVAQELGVSRYTIYNYLKSPDATSIWMKQEK